MVILYWTDKFKSVNIFAMAIWGLLAEFNSCQYFQLYGILYTLSGMCVPRWKCFLASRLCLGTCHTWMQGSTPGAYNEMGTLHSSSTCKLSWEWVLWVSEAQQLKYWFDDGPSQMGQLKKKQNLEHPLYLFGWRNFEKHTLFTSCWSFWMFQKLGTFICWPCLPYF